MNKTDRMNKLLEWLAGIGKMKYFYNSALDGAYYEVTGHMTDVVSPVSQIDEIAKAFNLKISVKNDTLLAWSPVVDAGFEMRAEKQLAEKAATDQPANLPESKSEGVDK